MLTDEVMSNLDVLGLDVLNRAVGNLDSTLVVAEERHFVYEDSVVPQSLPHPQQLSAAASNNHILSFRRGHRDAVLLL